MLGTNTAIFARDEYQKDAGNLCHNHLIFAVNTSTVNGNSERFIQDLIRTSVLEVAKTNDDIQRLLANGLLKSIDEISEVTARASIILRHNCDDQYKVRIRPGEGPENFRCRKLHSVSDCPDPATYNYVSIPYKYQESTLDILKVIDMYISPVDDGDLQARGKFTHAYFEPNRHTVPCNVNDDSNMSPVIVDFLMLSNQCKMHKHLIIQMVLQNMYANTLPSLTKETM